MKGLAVITGGAGNLGSAIARRLGEEGYVVSLLDRNESALFVTTEKLTKCGIVCIPRTVDVLNRTELKNVAEELLELVGPPKVVITATGYSPKHKGIRPDTLDICDEEWRATIDINLTSVFNTIVAFLPEMQKAQWGRIVTIASTAGLVGSPTAGVHYCAAKAGVVGLTKALAVEYAPYGILVNSVAPGKIENPNWEDSEIARESYLLSVPLKRLATSAEVSEVVAFLASDRNTYITGKVITVDGGRTPI